MKFSILVPVYNVEEYIEQCLESLANQTYRNYEVILVDDGSTDKSGKICDTYEQRYPDIFKTIHKQNQGLISARRVGIAMAESDYCLFVDSDDFVEKNLLETVVQYLKNDAEIDLLIYSFRYCIDGKLGDRYPKEDVDGKVWDLSNKNDAYNRFITSMGFTSLWTKVIRTNILKNDPTDYSVFYDKNMSEDILQSIYPISEAKKIVYADQVLYNYRINSESISRSFYPSSIPKKNTLHVYKQIKKYLPIWGIDNAEYNDKLKARWFNDFMYMFAKYYENASNSDDRKAIVEFDWDSMLPEGAYDINNIYENKVYKKLYCDLKAKSHLAIYMHFLRKKYYQQARKWKRKLLKGKN